MLWPPRIFFPQSYDQTSPKTLPALLTIHGGGFCVGHNRDDDEWNRHFADTHGVLVVALNYSKAPGAPFPTAIHDLEALVLAVLSDESLPIERSPRPPGSVNRTAILGFSAGGNLTMAVSQLPTVRGHALAPGAAVSVYGPLDFTIGPTARLANRPWKPQLGAPRGGSSDFLTGLAPTFDWSYIPYGHSLKDPLLSPSFARRQGLPPYIGLVAAELDMLAHDSWTMACRLSAEAGGRARKVPDRLSPDKAWSVCGREDVGKQEGALELKDERFAFEDRWHGGGVKWLLVPDVVHGFDHSQMRNMLGGGEATIKDSEMKTIAYVDEVGRWLKQTVWGL